MKMSDSTLVWMEVTATKEAVATQKLRLIPKTMTTQTAAVAAAVAAVVALATENGKVTPEEARIHEGTKYTCIHTHKV